MSEIPEVLPRDEHNATLISNVHPPDWTNPRPADRYNLVVIGAGSAGLITAVIASGLGARVAIVERHLMGGDCLNVGCVPSKALLRSAHLAAEVRDAADFGVRVPEGAHVDFPAVMERMRAIRSRISVNDSARRFQDELGVDVFIGDAHFSGADSVEVGGAQLRFKKAVIATGARATHPEVQGLAEAGYRTNETIFNLTVLPRRLAVIGAGPIGSEMAQTFRRLGSQVTIFEKAPHFLMREDEDAALLLRDVFRGEGIQIELSSTLRKVERKGDEKMIHFEREDGSAAELMADELDRYEIVIGLEVHTHLRTESKLFSPAPVRYGAEPNHSVHAIDLALPGVLPVLNERVVELAMQLFGALRDGWQPSLSAADVRGRWADPALTSICACEVQT